MGQTGTKAGDGVDREPVATLLRELEEQLLQPAVRHDPARAGALLTEEFREFGASGRRWTRQQILAELEKEAPGELSLVDFEAVPLAPEVYLVTYHSVRRLPDGELREALRSSVWRYSAGAWQMVFHQGTAIHK